ncbi:MAG: signal peptide peptidase SppA [Polyangiaceae bacterium]
MTWSFRTLRTSSRAALLLGTVLAVSSLHCDDSDHDENDETHDPTTAHGSGPPSRLRLAELDLSRGLPESKQGGLFRAEGATLLDLVEDLEAARKDEHVGGLFVRFSSNRTGWGRAAEVIRGLQAFRASKKPVLCHADNWTNSTYWIASMGCDAVWASPAGGVDTVGIGAELMFAKGLLDKLGVKADVLQVGKFKGTGETFTRETPSEEARASLEGVLGSIRAQWLDGVEAGRKRPDLRGAVEDGPFSAEEAKARGLLDAVGYADEAREEAKKIAKTGRTEVWFSPGKPGHKNNNGELVELLRVLSGARRAGTGGSPYVAVVRANGAITMERSGGLLSDESGIAARPLLKTLRDLAHDKSAKAVVLRIDSPGGSALASDLLWHDLIEVRKKKPLIVSVGDMAASGGYYMACAATKIVAEETSIVGSIGVVGGKMALGPALAPFGVNVVPIPAASGATRATMESTFTPWDDATKARVLGTMTSIYDLFLKRVSEGRNMPVETVAGFAEGRIFAGREAKALGMIDEVGGIRRAIEIAKSEASLDDKTRVRVIGESPGLFDVLDGNDDSDDDARASSVVPKLTREMAEAAGVPNEVLLHGATLAPLLRGERALVALPFALEIR